MQRLCRPTQPARPEGAPSWDDVSYWDGDGVAGAPRLEINLGEQRAYFYKGGELVGVSVCENFVCQLPTTDLKVVTSLLTGKKPATGG